VRKVVRALESVGFSYVRTKGSHAVYRDQDGRVVIIQQHGVVKRGTLASILRQAGLTPVWPAHLCPDPQDPARQLLPKMCCIILGRCPQK
jgi:predicted RNA binding protein YcfA (HicA-like mRNA interferase family)